MTSLVLSCATLRNSIGGIQDAVAAFAVDWAFAVIRNPEPVRVHIRTFVRDEAHPVLVDEMVGCLCSVGQMMNVFHAIDQIGERLTTDRFDLAQMEGGWIRPSSILPRVLSSAIAFSVTPQVAGHHIEARCPVVVHVRRRIVKVARQEPTTTVAEGSEERWSTESTFRPGRLRGS